MESYKKWISFSPRFLSACLIVCLSVCLSVRPHEFYWCANSGSRRHVSEIYALLGFYATLNCTVRSLLRTFQEILSAPSSRVKQPRDVGKNCRSALVKSHKTAHLESVAYRGMGGFGVFNPHPRNYEGPPKVCQTQPDLWKLLKTAEFRAPTPQDVRKKGSKILELPRFAIVLH